MRCLAVDRATGALTLEGMRQLVSQQNHHFILRFSSFRGHFQVRKLPFSVCANFFVFFVLVEKTGPKPKLPSSLPLRPLFAMESLDSHNCIAVCENELNFWLRSIHFLLFFLCVSLETPETGSTNALMFSRKNPTSLPLLTNFDL